MRTKRQPSPPLFRVWLQHPHLHHPIYQRSQVNPSCDLVFPWDTSASVLAEAIANHSQQHFHHSPPPSPTPSQLVHLRPTHTTRADTALQRKCVAVQRALHTVCATRAIRIEHGLKTVPSTNTLTRVPSRAPFRAPFRGWMHRHLRLPTHSRFPLQLPQAVSCYTFDDAIHVWDHGWPTTTTTPTTPPTPTPLPSAVIRTTDGLCTFIDHRNDHQYRTAIADALARSPPHHPILVEAHVYPASVRHRRCVRARVFRWVFGVGGEGVLEEGVVGAGETGIEWVVRWQATLSSTAPASTIVTEEYVRLKSACEQLVQANQSCSVLGGCGRIGVCWVGEEEGMGDGVGWVVEGG